MKRFTQRVHGLRVVKTDVPAGVTDAEGNGLEPPCTIPFTPLAVFDAPDRLPPDEPRHAVRRSARLAA
jgi:hypothetical protein